MAKIILDCPNITGSSDLAGYTGKLPCESIRETLYCPQPTTSSSGVVTVNQARHSDICVVRYRDSGSPNLAAAASSATLMATVTITLFRVAGEPAVTTKYMEYTLTNAYISRYESGTLDAEGFEFEPYINPSDPMPPPEWGVAALLASTQMPAGVRQQPRPVRGGSRGMPAAANKELERIWFNAASVKWSHTTPNVEAGWNIVQGTTLG